VAIAAAAERTTFEHLDIAVSDLDASRTAYTLAIGEPGRGLWDRSMARVANRWFWRCLPRAQRAELPVCRTYKVPSSE
jgi:hypothetical protein